MSSLIARLDRVSFAYPDGPSLFVDLSLDLRRGEVLVVTGENGAGKSTLLDVLDGTLAPDAGRVALARDVARVSQSDMQGRAPQGQALGLHLAELGIRRAGLGLHLTGSPGEMRRALLERVLAIDASLVLLDEPTNHLDDDARHDVIELVRRAKRRSAVVIVTHDRTLVDTLADRTLLLHRGHALLVDGGWDAAWSAHEREQQARLEERRERREVAQQTRASLADARRRAGDAEKQRSAKTRMKGPKDHDASGLFANFRADSATARLSKDVTRLRTELARAERAWEEAPRAEKAFGAELSIDVAPLRRPLLCVVESAPFLDATVTIPRDARLRIAGPNGAGKSTLLHEIVRKAAVALDDDALFHLPQDLDAQEQMRALHSFHELPRDERGRAGILLAALGVDPTRIAASARPSCGEAKKLLLARALALRAQALVLDEPTNHLDLPSVERLARALARYPGALVIVTHDDGFATSSNLTERLDLGPRPQK